MSNLKWHPEKHLVCLFTAGLTLLLLGIGGTARAVTISDTEFLAANWSATLAHANNATHTTQQNVSGGNPSAYRFTEHSMLAPTPPDDSGLFVYHEYLAASHDPSANGAILSLDYNADQIEFNPPFIGAAITHFPAILQGGVVYVGPNLNFTTTSWTTASHANLVDTDFVDLASTPFVGGDEVYDNPDFSASGSLIRFGYVSGNSTPCCGGPSIVTEHGIDNWSMALDLAPPPAPAVPAVSSTALAVLTLMLALAAGLRLGGGRTSWRQWNT